MLQYSFAFNFTIFLNPSNA